MDKDQGFLVSSLTFKKTDDTTKPAIFECGEPISTVHLPLYVWTPEGWTNTRETDLYSLIQINLGSETAEVLIIFNYAKHNVNVGVSVYHFHKSTLRLSVCIRLKRNYPEQIQIHQKVFFKIQNAHCQCSLKSIFCLKKNNRSSEFVRIFGGCTPETPSRKHSCRDTEPPVRLRLLNL